MPIYEMICVKCKHMFEIFVRNGKVSQKCPECGSNSRKLMSSANSNFSKWSDTMKAQIKDALTPQTTEV